MSKTIIEQAFYNIWKFNPRMEDIRDLNQIKLSKEVMRLFAKEIEKLDIAKPATPAMIIRKKEYRIIKKREEIG